MGWDLWEIPEKAKSFNQVLDRLEKEAVAFAERHRYRFPRQEVAARDFPAHLVYESEPIHFSLTRSIWDEPDIELRWSTGVMERNIHLVLSSSDKPAKLVVAGAAWQDEDSSTGRIRRWVAETVRTVEIEAIELEKVDLREVLDEAFDKISALTLTQASQITPLPPRD